MSCCKWSYSVACSFARLCTLLLLGVQANADHDCACWPALCAALGGLQTLINSVTEADVAKRICTGKMVRACVIVTLPSLCRHGAASPALEIRQHSQPWRMRSICGPGEFFCFCIR